MGQINYTTPQAVDFTSAVASRYVVHSRKYQSAALISLQIKVNPKSEKATDV